jgi:hypothetical protein
MRDHVGLALNPASNDVFLDNTGSIALVRDAAAVGQHVRQRLKTHEGEWFLDITAGVPWLNEVLGFSYDPALAEAVVKAEILNTDAVTEITSFSVRFDQHTRNLEAFNITVSTEYHQEVRI